VPLPVPLSQPFLPHGVARLALTCSALALGFAPGLVTAPAQAQSATPGFVEDVVVIGRRASAAERLNATAGATGLIEADDLPQSANLTISRALAFAPGVVVQDFFGGNDQPRIQIRGSGLQQNPVERGVLMLRNGLPVNRADGSYIVGFANPAEAQSIEIFRGHAANRLGATVLGGALNLISPTGRSAPGLRLKASAGDFGQIGTGASAGYVHDTIDALLRVDHTERDGSRTYNGSSRSAVGANFGVRLSDRVTVRAFASYADLGFDVAGPLTRALLDSGSRSVFTGPTVTPTGAVNPGPNVVRDQPRREATQFHAGVRATGVMDAHLIDVALGYAQTDDMFRFPISAGVRDTRGDDATVVARYAYAPDPARAIPLFEGTLQWVTGTADRDYYLNLSGRRGAQFGRNRLKADTLSLNGGFNLPLGRTLTLSPSAAWSRATRDNQDRYAPSTRPTAAYSPANPGLALPFGAVPTVGSSYERTYEGWSPALGLTWRPDHRQTVFVSANQTFEPPTHDDLFATVNGTPNSSPGRPNPAAPNQAAAVFATPALKAQRATTVEMGWRARAGAWTWDAVAYHAWVRNELLSLRDETGVSLGAVNAPHTRHLGLELGLSLRMTPDLTGRLAYTWQDFRFHDDPLRGDNHLAGTPPHWVQAGLDWRPGPGWLLQGGVRWVPEKTPIDNLNTLYSDPYAVFDLRAEREIRDGLVVFAEGLNLFDETYAASTLVVDQARADQAVFLPGDGRAFGAGVSLKF